MAANRRGEAQLLRTLFALGDVFCWFIALFVQIVARYNISALTSTQWSAILLYTVAVATLQIVIGLATKLYRGRAPLASFEEITWLTGIVVVVGVICAPIFMTRWSEFPRGIAVLGPVIALDIMVLVRLLVRAREESKTSGLHADNAERVLIYGAGNGGQQLGRLLKYAPDAPFDIVGFIDDDPSKRNLHLAGTKVIGGRADIPRIVREKAVRTVILAIPSESKAFLRQFSDDMDELGLRLLVLPPVEDIVGGRVQLNQLHEVQVTDLLGRQQVRTDLSSIAGYLGGRVVLVTGAGGSIGSEIARQVHKFGPKELVLLDRDESGLHAVQLSIYGQAMLDTPDMVLCDIRDPEALEKVFARHKPQVVFHAAALKHLPMLEQYPDEGWKTNVIGTLNVLDCAARHGVRRFVNISTDKAADPSSILGRTKRTAEQLTAWFAQHHDGVYLSVRFGNVLGSRGSVLHTFYQQIEQGGPLTVVHPDVTRYFMTIPEACELTIQAGAIGQPGDVLVLDMGEPVKILDLARRVIAKSGKKVPIIYTGLRPGEKLNEVLFSESEIAGSTSHELISRVAVPPVDPALVRGTTTAVPLDVVDTVVLGRRSAVREAVS